MKKLSSNTIVHPDLYVERDADRQIVNIINEMGRPGYILVARQMGKTNLLINAKRNLERTIDVFAYIDLSNRYENDRECFRGIIDKILEANTNKLENIASEIISHRKTTSLASHREHSLELRKILNFIDGKLVIILDEIDSLTTAEYSDKIFAHVRSIYFERVNFNEFERLTYLLSGVTEPGDIIKDKAISPFNIGEKIYLGDFSKDEFVKLLKKAELEIDNIIEERIFYWANGNPRLTWEICSAIEDLISEKKTLDTDSVDAIVKRLYLTNYDRAPVDHIRSLVQFDKTLRDSVISIFYNKAESIPDHVRSKLYLSGVLGSDYEQGVIRIKNRIIESCLDPDWLREVGRADRVSMREAEEYFEAGNYALASEIFGEVLKEKDLPRDDKATAIYRFGFCSFMCRKYQDVIDCYEPNLVDKVGYRDLYIEQIYYLAMSYLELQRTDKAIEYFDIIENEGRSSFRHSALINKAIILYTDDKDNKEKSIKLTEMVIDAKEKGEEVSSYALSGAYFSLASISESEDKILAAEYFLKSYEVAEVQEKITPLILAVKSDPTLLQKYFEQVLDLLSCGKIKILETSNSGVGFSIRRLSELVKVIVENNSESFLPPLLSSVREYCLSEKSEYAEVVIEIGLSLVISGHLECGKKLLKEIVLSDREYCRPKDLFLANKYLYFFDSSYEEAEEVYFKGFQNYVETVDQLDLQIFQRKVTAYLDTGEVDKASKYCDLVLNSKNLTPNLSTVELEYLKFKTFSSISEKIKYAQLLKEHLKSTRKDILLYSFISEKRFALIKKAIDKFLIVNIRIETFIREEKKYGRNEKVLVKYNDESVSEAKYKNVKTSIENGLCVVIEKK